MILLNLKPLHSKHNHFCLPYPQPSTSRFRQLFIVFSPYMADIQPLMYSSVSAELYTRNVLHHLVHIKVLPLVFSFIASSFYTSNCRLCQVSYSCISFLNAQLFRLLTCHTIMMFQFMIWRLYRINKIFLIKIFFVASLKSSKRIESA